MTPQMIAMLIAAGTDAIIRISAKHDGVSFEEREAEVKAAIETLQPKADDLETWLRFAE